MLHVSIMFILLPMRLFIAFIFVALLLPARLQTPKILLLIMK